MKKNNWIFIICLITQIGVSQTTETIAMGDSFGEISVIGNTLYRGGQEATVVTYDLSTTSFDANTIATGPGSNPHLRFAVNPTQENVYLSEFAGPIFSADVSENNLTLIAQGMTTGGEVLGIAITGNTVYYSTSAPQILRFQMNDPDSTQEVFFDPASILPIFNMIIDQGTLYYSTQSDFTEPIDYQIFALDITETNPTPQLVTTTPERAWTFVVEGDLLYVGSDQNDSVYTKDLSDGTIQEATLLRTLDLGNATNLYSIDVEGDFFYYSSTGEQGGIYRIGVENLSTRSFTKSSLEVFPNPSNENIYISNVMERTPFALYSLEGKKVLSGIYEPNDVIHIANLAKGLYILELDRRNCFKVLKR